MRRLTGADAVYLYSETPTTPMHTLKITIFKPQTPLSLELIRDHFNAVIHRIPALRWRIVPVPFALHHPVAVEDPEFDIDFHLRHVALPQPGGHREFENMVGQIATHALDRHRPLWELWMVEGLVGGRVAFVLKLHHAVADGSASVQLFTRMISEQVDTDIPAWNPAPMPGTGRLIWDALVDQFKRDARRFPEVIRTVMGRYKALKLHRENSEILAVDNLAGGLTHCRFNGALTTQRKFAATSLSLTDFKALKEPMDGTINDIVLAVVAGALRSYLLEQGDSVQQALVATIPVSADEPGTERVFGNNFSQLATLLEIGIADPRERFRKIQQSTNAGKSELEILGRSTLPAIMNYLSPSMYSWLRRRDYEKQLARKPGFAVIGNVSVSNVPGPRAKLSSGGVELETLYSVGPLLEGSGLNITVWSYADQLNFSVIACKKLVPDPHVIANAIDAELKVLQETAAASS